MFPTFLVPFLVGVITAPLVGKIAKPLMHGTVKTTMGIALQAKKVATEAVEDLQEFSAEVSAGFAADDIGSDPAPTTAVQAGAKTGRLSGAAPKTP